MAKDNERERMPYIQVDSDLWAIMREDETRPRAMIKRITAYDGVEQYFLMTWHPDPTQRKLVRIHTSLEEANRSVKWREVSPKIPGRPTPANQAELDAEVGR